MSFRSRSQLDVGQVYDSRYSPVQLLLVDKSLSVDEHDPVERWSFVPSSPDVETLWARYNYTKSIQKIHSQLKKKKLEELKELKALEKQRQKELDIYQGKYTRLFWKIWGKTFAHVGEDWIILAVLGIFLAIISYTIDKGVMMCNKGQMWLYSELSLTLFSKWVAWICLPTCLVLWNVGLTRLIAPQAAGSGIPQLKTSLRGVFMKEVLTFKVLIVKWLGITATIGSGMPLGKEGPLIHMSSIVVTKLSKAISSFNQVYANESKKIEMLGAAWAVGVACTFNAPIGGVLFSVEITTAYYAVRNYWRGFFAAVWGATTYRLLLVWIDGVETISVIFRTNFFMDIPYDPLELISFAILGLICGLGGSLYICVKQIFDTWANSNKFIKKMKQLNCFIYPTCVILIISTITWPDGTGQFMASDITAGVQVQNLFSNFTWTHTNLTVSQQAVISHWSTKWSGVYTNLIVYFWYQFLFSIMAASLPVPNGSFIPNFRAGAALGRIAGELMSSWFPFGLSFNGMNPIMPGAYATVGAAAFTGAVTHTMSVCVILFEMTSSITHVIPVLIAVLIANGVARFLTPSIYDLVIRSKKLPYLPDLLPNTSAIYEVYVEDFMVRDLKHAYLGMTYAQLKDLLVQYKKLKVFPIVDHPQNMTLLGSVPRQELILLLDRVMGVSNRRRVIPSPMVDRIADPFENVEVIPRRRKDTVVMIDDSSDSEKEDDQPKTDIKMHETARNNSQNTESKDDILKKWSAVKVKSNLTLNIPKSPLPERKITKSASLLEVPHRRAPERSTDPHVIWEESQLKQQVDFSSCPIDPAPFQLVERTSLLKVHSLFSLLAINVAYVTSIGRLVGVVSLKELRHAIEEANSGNSPKRPDRTMPTAVQSNSVQTPDIAVTPDSQPPTPF